MGRIQKALSKAKSEGGGGKRRSSRNRRQQVKKQLIEFSKLPTMQPDQDLLIKNRIVASQVDAPGRSVYKILRTRLLQRMRSAQWNVIGVSGSGPGEGKTLTAINLAYSLAQEVNHRVVLVDLDLRRPSIHNYLGIEPRFDLDLYLKEKATLQQLLVRPGEERLAVITNKTPHRESSEILSSPRLVTLVDELSALGLNTITVLDLPPFLAGDDVLAVSPLMDALLLVVAEGICKRENLVDLKDLLKDTDIIGTVLNRSRERSSSMDYYDYY